MNTDWINTIADSAAAIMALLAVAISVVSLIISKRFHSDTSKTNVLEQQYDAFNELGVMRIEHYTLNHLLEVPENYKETLKLVELALNNPTAEQKAETILKERALAMYIFQIFEHTYYQYMHSKESDNFQRADFLKEVLKYFTGRLLNNPRLLYFWNEGGGNLCIYFEPSVRAYYKDNLATKEEVILTSMDRTGPFPQINKMSSKHSIYHNNILSDTEREEYWEKTHCQEDYETVWSMTDDKEVRRKILNELSSYGHSEKILIPGCGSRVALQNQIARNFTTSNILCTDFEGVIELAKKQHNEDNIKYEARNSSDLGFDNEWDVVVIVNSVLSESDEENRSILKSCYRALKPGGILVGYFPTIFASVDIAYLESDQERMAFVDIDKSSFYEEKQKIWQIFYTPLRLRMILAESQFIRDRVEIFFCDSDYFASHSKDYYGIEDQNLPIYEHFVVAHKDPLENS